MRTLLLYLLMSGAAAAQDADRSFDGAAPQALSIELNAAADTHAGGCTLSFLLTNGHGSDLQNVVFETVLFGTDGQVDRLTLFDFGTLPAGRPRVRQFTLPGTSCDGYGRILFNGVQSCEVADRGDDPTTCTDGLALSSRTDIEVLG